MNIYHVLITRVETIEVQAGSEGDAIYQALDGEGNTVDEETVDASAMLVLITDEVGA